MDSASPLPVPRAPSRRWLYIPVVLFSLLCLAWTGVWFFARGKTIDVMDAWMAREAAAGRVWACPERSVDGFPFRLQVACTAPTFVSSEPGRAGQGSLGKIAVNARVVDPKNLIAVFASPLRWQGSTGEALEMTFDEARASYRGDPGSLDQISVELVKSAVTWRIPGFEPQTLRSQKSELHLRRTPGSEPGTDIALVATSIESAALDALSGDAAPGNLDIRAGLAKLPPVPPRDWRRTLEDWRLAGGEARIERFNLAKGPLSLTSTGALRLDDLRRLAGSIEGQATGLTQVLARFGVSLGGGGVGGLLGSILGGANAQRPDARPRPLPVNIRFDNGRVFFWPIPGPRLAPLF